MIGNMNYNYYYHTVTLKNYSDVAHYNFDTDQPILINFWQVIATEFELS